MLRHQMRLSWISAVGWYLAAGAIAAVGTRLAYGGPLSSDAWRCWSGPNAWERDVARLVVASILALFMLWNMDAFAGEWKDQKDHYLFFRLRRYEWVTLLLVIAVLLLVTLQVNRQDFRTGLPARAALQQSAYCRDIESRVSANQFGQILKPYFPYLLYVFGLWIGVVLPVFLVLLRRLRADWEHWKESRSRLDDSVKTLSQSHLNSPTFETLLLAFQDHIIGVKEVAERYVPVLLAISLILLYEQLTTSKQTVTPPAVELGKLALWLLLGPVLIACVTMVAIGYQNAAHKVESGFRILVRASVKSSGSAELVDRIVRARAKLMWDESPASFVLSVAKSATISIPLLLTVTAYVLHSLSGPEGWIGIFIPKAVINFVKNIFR